MSTQRKQYSAEFKARVALEALKGQPFQHDHLCAMSLAVETCFPF
jgi:transposase-like protein